MSPEIREDVLTGGHVVIAPARRGIGATKPGGLPVTASCPFCPGHEAETERSLLSFGDPWAVRVVANRFPLTPAHEVLIESRDHDADLGDYTPAHAALVLRAARDRMRAIGARPGIAAISFFRNRGRRAGSSQPHPHAQIVGLPTVPPEVARRAAIMERDPSTLARAIARERMEASRVIEDREDWITFCPYASGRAWETRIAPAGADAPVRFADVDDERLESLGGQLVRAVARIRAVVGDHDYNVLLRDPPVATARGYFTIDLLPRTGGDAGFELQSGMGVCVVAPEEAARQLRGG